MRHRVKTFKLGRKTKHKEALLANLACSLIKHNRIKTTLPKAKALRPYAEKLITLGKKGSIHGRRLAFAKLRNKTSVKQLFDEVAPRFTEREGGYTRIYKLGNRLGDAAEMALIEWVEAGVPGVATEETASETASKVEETPTATEEAPKDEESKVETAESKK